MKKLIFLIIFFCIACTEQFHPQINNNISILVVDGKITTESGPYEIRLFRTVSLDASDTLKPEKEAIITIHDDMGNNDFFLEVSPGIYQNQDPTFTGKIGQTYWIEIETSNGDKFESLPEMIPPKISIESIYPEEGEKLLSNGSKIKAVEYYLDAIEPTNNSSYMRWEYKESWEWRSPYRLPKTTNPSSICYPNANSNNVYIFDGSKLSIKKFNHLSSTFITNEEVKLNYQYFLKVSMYSVTKDCYKFWEQIKQSIEENGSLYNVTPSNATGNILPCNSNSPVLGYFEASSVDHKHITNSISDFSMKFPSFPPDCEDIIIRRKEGRPDENIFHIVNSWMEGEAIVFQVRFNYCYDCNVKYSSNKPSFWP
jgi:hypothetical protein